MIDDSANNDDGVCVDIGTTIDQDGNPEKEYWRSFKFKEVSCALVKLYYPPWELIRVQGDECV